MGLHGRLGETEQRRDVRSRSSLDVMQGDHLRLPSRESTDLDPQMLVLDRRLVVVAIHAATPHQSIGFDPCPAPQRHRTIRDDPTHPRARVVVPADVAPAAIRSDERLLRQVLSGLPATRQHIRQPDHRTQLTAIEDVERLDHQPDEIDRAATRSICMLHRQLRHHE